MASNSSQRLAKERQASQGSFSTSSLSSSASSLSKSANGPVQQSNRSKATSKRPVTPNSRAPSTIDNEPVLKVPTKRSVTPISRTNSIIYSDPEPGRVRVSVRLRPINDDLASDADYADCVELQPEMKKLKLRKSNWNSESYKFDEVFTATATQKRVYQVAAKPVVESVLSGFNGTIMAYGQTGTGKTYTVGNLGKDDASERGIMVRALEDIIANTSPAHDTVEVSYLQLYVDSVQDLLSPDKINIPIVEERKTGEVLLPGSTVVKIRDLDHFMELLQKGEAHRHAANTKMNTNSSRSHAILMVYVRRSVPGRLDTSVYSHEKVRGTDFLGSTGIGTFQRSKLLIVDLAGSERIGKSGSEGQLLEEAKFINLSLTSLGKCINALAENSCHIPTRESKLTRLLRDSFGGSARTSLIITIGPSARHHAETFSTIMFGQRAMKIVNMVKLKEEFDYERSYRKLEIQVDHLTREIDRQQKLRDNYINEMEKKLKECQLSFAEAEKSLVTRSEILEKENARLEMEMKDTLAELNHEKDFNKWLHDEVARLEMCLEHCKQEQHENSTYQSAVADTTEMYEKQIAELIEQLEYEQARFEDAEGQLDAMKKLLSDHEMSIKQHQLENLRFQNLFSDTTQAYEKKIEELTKHLEDEHAHRELAEARVGSLEKLLSDQNSIQSKDQIDNSELREKLEELDHKRQSEVTELQTKLEKVNRSHEMAINELLSFKVQNTDLLSEKDKIRSELETALNKLLDEEKQRMILENELIRIRKVVLENNEDFEDKKLHMSRGSSSFRTTMSLHGSLSGQRSTISNFCEEVGLEKILSLLSSEDTDLQMQAIKVVANLAAEDNNQEKIVNGGGLDALLMLLRSSQSITILRVASGAIANLAMKETNQSLIMSKGGAELLASTASKTDDPQTFRMVAGAIANLCGNVNLHLMLEQEECIKALIGMARYGNPDVVAQVARGLANFAKCETREVTLGNQKGRSLLMEDGALAWLIDNANTTSASARRHIELALCHLAQNEDNTRDFISTGGLKEVIRIASESTNEDIRNLAKRTLKMNPTFQAQLCTMR